MKGVYIDDEIELLSKSWILEINYYCTNDSLQGAVI